MKYKFIDLFAGIGGFRAAIESIEDKKVECVFSSEIDKFAKQVYEHNFGDEPTGDITKVDPKDIPDFDLLAGGFPCQPFSYAGRLEGFEDQTRGTLFFDIVRILSTKKPKMFILENVKGLKSHNKGETLKIIEETLTKLGYDIHWKILDSYDFGVPQYRERWFCVGFNKKVDFKFPEGGKSGSKLADIVDVNNDDPSLKLTDFEIQRIIHHFSSSDIRVQHDNSKYAPHTKKGKYGVYSYLKPDKTLRFHIGDVAKTQIQEAYYSSLESVAPAIIATREPKLWDLRRKLSVDECRKLQGFPDWFEFNVSNAQAKKQLGNAVTVPVIREIVKSMFEQYEKADSNFNTIEKPSEEQLTLQI